MRRRPAAVRGRRGIGPVFYAEDRMRFVMALLAVFFSFSAAAAGQEKQDDAPARCEEAARKFVSLLSEGKHDGASALLDAGARKIITAEKMREAWAAAVERYGAFKEIVSASAERADEQIVSLVTVKFEKGGFDVKVVFSKEGGITGFSYVQSRKAVPYSPPSYADAASFTEKNLKFGADGWQLPATLAMPAGEGPFPALVLVHGSGPNDRDETIGPNKPFKDIAWGLASSGIAVLRYDKRTLVHGSKMAAAKGHASFTINEETVDDAVLAAALLANADGVDKARIFVLGHSLGGMMIPRIAGRCPAAAGFVILAGLARPLGDTLVEQYTYIFSLDGSLSETEKNALCRMREQAARAKDPALAPDAPAESLPLGCPAAYWIDLRGYKPAEEAAAVEKPVLVLQGERDYQVTMEDLELWRKGFAARPAAEFKSYPALNHLFMAGKGKAVPVEYSLPGHVSKELISDLAKWIKAR